MSGVYEVAPAGAIDEVRCQAGFAAEVTCRANQGAQDVAWMTSAELPLSDVVGSQEVGKSLWIERYTEFLALRTENFRELLDRWVSEMDLVWNSSQERLVDEVGWLEIRRENHQPLEGYLDLLASVQGKDIDPLFQWNNPAIEQSSWRHPLSAKIIDEEHPIVRS